MKILKQAMITFMVVTVFISQLAVINREAKAGNMDIVVNGYSANGGNAIYKGTAFDLTLEVTKGEVDMFDSMYVEIGNASNFYGERSNIVKLSSSTLSSINAGGPTTISGLRLIYKGTGNELLLTFKYSVDGDNLESAQTIFIKNAVSKEDTPTEPEPQKYPPTLALLGGTAIPTITAGTTQTLNIPIKNTSQNGARNILFSLQMEDKTKAPQILDVINISQELSYLNANETKNVPFDVSILSTAPEGVYSFKLSYQMQNLFGATFSSADANVETFYVRVKNENTSPSLTLQSFQANPSTAVPGGKVNLRLVIQNNGSLDAKNIKLVLNGLKADTFTIPEGTSTRYISKLEGYGKYTIDFTLQASASILAGSQSLDIKMDYKDAQNNSYSEENQIFIPVGSKEQSGRAFISLDKIVSPDTSVKPNKDFSIGMSLVNTGSDTARNIKVTLSSDSVIVPKSLSTVMISTLEKGKSIPVSFNLFATSESLNKNYPIAINVEYEQGEGEKAVKYTATQYIGVLVENPDAANRDQSKSVPRIIIDQYSFEPGDVKAGVDFTLKLSFLNTSKISKVGNIKVTVSTDDGGFVPVESGNTFFIEEIGCKENVQRSIMLRSKPDAEPKSYIVSVSFEYEDAKTNPFTTRETVSIPVSQNARLVVGELSLPQETYTGQPLPIYVEFYNMGKSILYNLTVKAEGNFQAQNGNYFVGNFEPGRSDSFDSQVTPDAPGQLKGSLKFTFEDAAGKKTEVIREFDVKVVDMPQETIPGEGQDPGMDPEGQPQAQKSFIVLYAIVPGSVLIIGVITFIILRRRSIRRKEMTLDE